MQQDLQKIRDTLLTTHPEFKDFRESIDAAIELSDDKARIEKKALMFIDTAIDALHKHFIRWTKPVLLPAALLSESPLAVTIARIIVGMDRPIRQPGEVLFKSAVHGREFHLQDYDDFVFQFVDGDNDGDFAPKDVQAATSLLHQGLDPRQQIDNLPSLAEYLLTRYLPLASQTQFVEASVKEAKNVSQTGREEQLRSAIAIERSHGIIGSGKLSGLTGPQKAEQLIQSARNKTRQQSAIKASLGTIQYQKVLDSIKEEVYKEITLKSSE